MMRRMSVRFRINLVITLVIVAFTVATGNLLIEETRRSIREEMEAGTRITAQLLETVIANTRPSMAWSSGSGKVIARGRRVPPSGTCIFQAAGSGCWSSGARF